MDFEAEARSVAEKISADSLFSHRMAREGKTERLRDQMSIMRQKLPGLPAAKLRNKVRSEKMGFVNRANEIDLYVKWFVEVCKIARREMTPESKRRETEKKKRESLLQDALQTLPSDADPYDEANWVRVHPAMMKKDRGEVNEGGRVVIGAEDIDMQKNPPPSRAAVFLLQNACNDPKGFYKEILKNIKPPESDIPGEKSDRPDDADMNLKQAHQIIKDALK